MSYNSSKGTIYLEHGVDPKIGVSIRDVQRALATTRNDLGQLCKHANLNKWATFKPMPAGTVEQINRDGTAPYGLRTIYNKVNPSTGAVSSSNNTTLRYAVETLLNAIIGGNSNPFLEDLTMYIKPIGNAATDVQRAYRLTDFVTTQSVRGTTPVRGRSLVHGYKVGATLRYGYHDQSGAYHGLYGRSISVNSDGNIVADGNQSIDQSASEIWGETFADLDTRLSWSNSKAEENDLCVLDWLDAMFSIRNNAYLHRAVCLFTGDWIEHTGFVAVGTVPWAAGANSWANAIAGDPTREWHCIEFLTNASVTSDFVPLESWNTNNAANWYLIPGLIYRGMYIASNDPYLIGAEFMYADTNQFSPYGFNCYVKIRSLGLNTQLTIFLSTTSNPDSIHDYVRNINSGYTVSATGTYNIYGTNPPAICPSDVTNANYRKFNEVFTVGQVYYICIWGQSNQSGSSERVIWSQAVLATADDMLVVVR